jgi:ABC-type transport system substrate-binding protein
MKALLLLLIQLSQKYNLIYLQSHFQWFTPIRRKLNIQPDIAKSWTISPDAKPILLRCERTSIFKSTFYLVTIVREL